MDNKRRSAVLAALLIAATPITATLLSTPSFAQTPAPAAAPAATPAPAAPAAAPAGTAVAGSDASGVIQKFDDALISVMKQATTLGYDGRYAKLEPVIQQTFNVPFMTKIVVGAPWTTWTQAQRDAIIDAFGKFIVATYARRFDGYGGESFAVDGSQPSGTNLIVQTHLNRPHDSAITLNYLMRQNSSGNWKAVDVFLTGSISELATRRSEFSSVLGRGGYDALLSELKAKSKPDGTDLSPG